MTKRHRQLATKHAELDAQRLALIKEGQQISERAEQEKRALAAEEKTRTDEILAELKTNKEQIDAINADIEREMALEAFEKGQIADPTAASRSAGRVEQVDAEFRGFGEFLQAVAMQSNQGLRMSLGSRAKVLEEKLGHYMAAGSGMSVGTPADGGYLVRKDWSTAMLDRATQQAQLLPRCRPIPIGQDADSLEYPYVDESSRVDGSRWGGVQVFWKAEAATVAAKQPKMGRGELRLEEIMGLAYATERLLRDSTALEGLLGNAFESEFAFKIDDSILRGSGVGQMLGVLNSPALVTQAAEGGQTADTITIDNVLKMFARMPARLKPGSVWTICSDAMTQLPKMVIGQQPVWIPPGGLANSPLGSLLGRPVIEIEQASAIGDVGDIMFSNFMEYVAITKAGEGLRYDTSMHVRFLNDEMAFRWVYRINGQPTWRTALTPFKGSNTLSPFIALAAR